MKIVCVGRNYAAHATELGNTLPDRPVIFIKSANALSPAGNEWRLPTFGKNIHYELELALRISRRVSVGDTPQLTAVTDGVALALDMTDRDEQTRLKDQGLPWELAKSFDGSAVLSQVLSWEALPPWDELSFTLHIDGELRQQGATSMMLHQPEALIAFIAQRITLEPGDVLLTGTPSGVGRILPGQRLVGTMAGMPLLDLTVI